MSPRSGAPPGHATCSLGKVSAAGERPEPYGLRGRSVLPWVLLRNLGLERDERPPSIPNPGKASPLRGPVLRKFPGKLVCYRRPSGSEGGKEGRTLPTTKMLHLFRLQG